MAGIRRVIDEETAASWKRQDILNAIDTGCKTLRDQAFIVTLYLTGARISEIVRKLKLSQLEVIDDPRGEILRFKALPVLKKRARGIIRNVDVRVDMEKEFIDYLDRYAHDIGEEGILFPFSRIHGYTIVYEATGLYPHVLRALRATDLLIRYQYSAEHVRKFFQWSNLNMVSKYIKLSSQELVDKMFEAKEKN